MVLVTGVFVLQGSGKGLIITRHADSGLTKQQDFLDSAGNLRLIKAEMFIMLRCHAKYLEFPRIFKHELCRYFLEPFEVCIPI